MIHCKQENGSLSHIKPLHASSEINPTINDSLK